MFVTMGLLLVWIALLFHGREGCLFFAACSWSLTLWYHLFIYCFLPWPGTHVAEAVLGLLLYIVLVTFSNDPVLNSKILYDFFFSLSSILPDTYNLMGSRFILAHGFYLSWCQKWLSLRRKECATSFLPLMVDWEAANRTKSRARLHPSSPSALTRLCLPCSLSQTSHWCRNLSGISTLTLVRVEERRCQSGPKPGQLLQVFDARHTVCILILCSKSMS